jgi:hypothetical protein
MMALRPTGSRRPYKTGGSLSTPPRCFYVLPHTLPPGNRVRETPSHWTYFLPVIQRPRQWRDKPGYLRPPMLCALVRHSGQSTPITR